MNEIIHCFLETIFLIVAMPISVLMLFIPIYSTYKIAKKVKLFIDRII